MKHSLKRASVLRDNGIKTEVFFNPGKLKKQFGYADKKNIPLVCIEGENERRDKVIKIKQLSTGKEFTFEANNAAEKIKEILTS